MCVCVSAAAQQHHCRVFIVVISQKLSIKGIKVFTKTRLKASDKQMENLLFFAFIFAISRRFFSIYEHGGV
jgi:hypothetical protein